MVVPETLDLQVMVRFHQELPNFMIPKRRRNKIRRRGLSAREATLLTFIAQRPDSNDARALTCLYELDGTARSIARVMLKMDGIYSKKTKKLAARWLDWVSQL